MRSKAAVTTTTTAGSKDENITILLVSSSKLLKNKFIEAVSNEINHFSLMNKSITTGDSERLNFACFVCDYSIDQGSTTNYMQIIDVNGKYHKLKTNISKELINILKS